MSTIAQYFEHCVADDNNYQASDDPSSNRSSINSDVSLRPPLRQDPSLIRKQNAVSKGRDSISLKGISKLHQNNNNSKDNRDTDSHNTSDKKDSPTFNYFNDTKPISMHIINDESDVYKLMKLFDKFENLLRLRRQICMAHARVMLAKKRESMPGYKNGGNNNGRKRHSIVTASRRDNSVLYKRKSSIINNGSGINGGLLNGTSSDKGGKNGKNDKNGKKRQSMTVGNGNNKGGVFAKTNDRHNNNNNGKGNDNNDVIYIDSSHICSVINSIGLDYSDNLYNIRRISNDLINKLKTLSKYEIKIDKYKRELHKSKSLEYPRIANEIKKIQSELNELKKPKIELKKAVNRLKKIKNNDLNNIRTLKKPHSLLIKTIQACAILTGEIDINRGNNGNGNNSNSNSGRRSSNVSGNSRDSYNGHRRTSMPATYESTMDGLLNANNIGIDNNSVDELKGNDETSDAGSETSTMNNAGDIDAGQYNGHNMNGAIRNVNSLENWNDVRKLLKPSFIQKLARFDVKNIDSDIKNYIKVNYLGVDKISGNCNAGNRNNNGKNIDGNGKNKFNNNSARNKRSVAKKHSPKKQRYSLNNIDSDRMRNIANIIETGRYATNNDTTNNKANGHGNGNSNGNRNRHIGLSSNNGFLTDHASTHEKQYSNMSMIANYNFSPHGHRHAAINDHHNSTDVNDSHTQFPFNKHNYYNGNNKYNNNGNNSNSNYNGSVAYNVYGNFNPSHQHSGNGGSSNGAKLRGKGSRYSTGNIDLGQNRYDSGSGSGYYGNDAIISLTYENVSKVNANVAGVLIEWLISIIKCHDILPNGNVMNSKLNELHLKLNDNTKKGEKYQDSIFELTKNVKKFQTQIKFNIKRIMKYEENIQNHLLISQLEIEASKI